MSRALLLHRYADGDCNWEFQLSPGWQTCFDIMELLHAGIGSRKPMKPDMLSLKNLRVLTRSSCAYGFGNDVIPMLTRSHTCLASSVCMKLAVLCMHHTYTF